jgi:hypothetical protein
MLHTLRFSLQNAVYFIMLSFLVLYYSHFTYRACQNLNLKLRCQKVNNHGLKLNGTYQLLAYADDVNIWEEAYIL